MSSPSDEARAATVNGMMHAVAMTYNVVGSTYVRAARRRGTVPVPRPGRSRVRRPGPPAASGRPPLCGRRPSIAASQRADFGREGGARPGHAEAPGAAALRELRNLAWLMRLEVREASRRAARKGGPRRARRVGGGGACMPGAAHRPRLKRSQLYDGVNVNQSTLQVGNASWLEPPESITFVMKVNIGATTFPPSRKTEAPLPRWVFSPGWQARPVHARQPRSAASV